MSRPAHGSGSAGDAAGKLCQCIPSSYEHDSLDLWIEIDAQGRAGRFVTRPHLEEDVSACLRSRLSGMHFQSNGKAHTKQVHVAFPKSCVMAESGWTVKADAPSMTAGETRKKDILKAGIVLATVGGAFTMLSLLLGIVSKLTCESSLFNMFDEERDCASCSVLFYLAIPGAGLTAAGIVTVIVGSLQPKGTGKEPSKKLAPQVALAPDFSRGGAQAVLSWRF